MSPTQMEGEPLHDASRPSVERRIQDKIDILQRYVNEGLPDDVRPHVVSLTRIRVWEDPTLGLYAIASPNAFTTTHRQHGDAVRRLAQLSKELRRSKKGSAVRPSARPEEPVVESKNRSALMSRLMSQYVMERERAERSLRQLHSMEAAWKAEQMGNARLRHLLDLPPAPGRPT